MEKTLHKTRVVLKQGDITKEDTDVIVNAANSGLMGGGGVDGAIHQAGGPAILEECKKIREKRGRCPTGKAVLTAGGNLKARHVVHAVGPIWHGGQDDEPALLGNAYSNSLKLAEENGARTIAFPSISTGAYGFPVEEAARVALKAVEEYCGKGTSLEEVRLVLFSEEDYRVYEEALKRY